MLALKLAFKNLMAAGLRSWLNAIVLAFAYLLIIFFNGLMDGWNAQGKKQSIGWEFGQGQVWHPEYDPYDPFSLEDAHDLFPEVSASVPVLVRQASIYPSGRMQSVLLKGIPANQNLLELPTHNLVASNTGAIPVIIGERMASNSKLKVGDQLLMRWRDKNGTFDAQDIEIVSIFSTDVQSIDLGHVWIDLERLQGLTGYTNQATYLVSSTELEEGETGGWPHHTLGALLKPLDDLIATKKISSSIMYIILLGLALLAIFDTQVLSIFKRQKEIGTYVALGMTRWEVVRLFTFEGGAISILGAIMAAVIGTPLFYYLAKSGLQLPAASTENSGITIGDVMYPVFGLGLVLGTVVIIVLTSTLVSFWPAKRISKLDPTQALKGKIQ